MTTLTALERDLLEFERWTWRHPGARDQAIHDLFALSAPRHAQILNALIDQPAALVHDPATVNRLRRLRDHRRQLRAG